MKYCTNCGKELADDELLCPNCGQVIGCTVFYFNKAVQEEKGNEAPVESSTPDEGNSVGENKNTVKNTPAEAEVTEEEVPEKGKKGNKKTAVIIIIIAAVVVIAGVAIGIVVSTSSSDYTYTVLENGTEIEITEYTGDDTTVIIPSEIDGYTVTALGESLFMENTSLTSVTIPNSVTSIGKHVFGDCNSLTSITIPDSVTSIGEHAFLGCSSLTSITIPNSVTSIGEDAFGNCTSLKSITIPNSVTSIGDWAFSHCDSLTSVTIPDSVTSIGNDAFYSCESLTSVTIPDSVASIGNSAFDDCTSLTSVTIPDSVTSIGDYAFDDCTSLTSITVDSNNAYYSSEDGVLFNKDKTELICYPAGKSNSSYAIPSSVTSIGKRVFGDCNSLTSITIPDSVTSIGYYAFDNCSSLTDVYYDGTKSDWNSIEIDDSNTDLKAATIHCSDGDIEGVAETEATTESAGSTTSGNNSAADPGIGMSAKEVKNYFVNSGKIALEDLGTEPTYGTEYTIYTYYVDHYIGSGYGVEPHIARFAVDIMENNETSYVELIQVVGQYSELANGLGRINSEIIIPISELFSSYNLKEYNLGGGSIDYTGFLTELSQAYKDSNFDNSKTYQICDLLFNFYIRDEMVCIMICKAI